MKIRSALLSSSNLKANNCSFNCGKLGLCELVQFHYEATIIFRIEGDDQILRHQKSEIIFPPSHAIKRISMTKFF